MPATFDSAAADLGLSATFHLTHDCTLRCTYCYTGEKTRRPMSEEVADRAVDLTLAEAEKRAAPWIDVTIFGGEPLLEKTADLAHFRAFSGQKGPR